MRSACRLVDALDIAARNWDPPVHGLPAVALAAGKLMKLPPEKLAQAVNLSRSTIISRWGRPAPRPIRTGREPCAPRPGATRVFAAMLARGGITGPAPIFEGPQGLLPARRRGRPRSRSMASVRKGVPFRIHQCGMKPYPAVIYSQTAIAAAIALARRSATWSASAPSRSRRPSAATSMTGRDPEKWTPENRDTADHSLALHHDAGDVRRRHRQRQLRAGQAPRSAHARLHAQDQGAARTPALTARTGRRVVPTRASPRSLLTGRRVVRGVDDVPGFVGRPMGRATSEPNSAAMSASAGRSEKTDAVLKALWGPRRDQGPVGPCCGMLLAEERSRGVIFYGRLFGPGRLPRCGRCERGRAVVAAVAGVCCWRRLRFCWLLAAARRIT